MGDVSYFQCYMLCGERGSYFRGAYYRDLQQIALVLNIVGLWEAFLILNITCSTGNGGLISRERIIGILRIRGIAEKKFLPQSTGVCKL